MPDSQIAQDRQTAATKSRSTKDVRSCNFRTAGRLSNEDARTMTEMQERVAQQIGAALDSYLGKSVEVKFEKMDQLPIKDYVAHLQPLSYIASFRSMSFFVEFGRELAFPMVNILMGGSGDDESPDRDLSEIEEEVVRDIVLSIAQQCDLVWKASEAPLTAGPRMKAAMMHQSFAASEKAAVLHFGVACAGTTGSFRVVLTTEFLGTLLKKAKQGLPQKKSRILSFAMAPLRERILDCDLDVNAELTNLRVSVRDLVALQPGTVLKLRAPIREPAVLAIGGRAIFEAAPVRNGFQRAAQVGKQVRS